MIPLRPALLVASAAFVAACSSNAYTARPVAVAPAPPAKDDGKPAKGGDGGTKHAAARTATLAMSDDYAVAYATYPAWKGACLVVGAAVPARDEPQRARAVRDRFVREVLPKIEITKDEEPKDRF